MNAQTKIYTSEEIEAAVANLPDDLKDSVRQTMIRKNRALEIEEDNESEEVNRILQERKKSIKKVDDLLNALPKGIIGKLKEKINNIVNYEPTIGIMGGTGVGKSSLINAIFGGDICKTSTVRACTRDLQTVKVKCGNRFINFVDLPGIGETIERDDEYFKMYAEVLPKLDLVLWANKSDDRAYSINQEFYKSIIARNNAEDKIIFVITQADKIEADDPFEPGFSKRTCTLSPGQLRSLEMKKYEMMTKIAVTKNPIVAVSAPFGVNIQELVEVILNALPANAKSGVYSTVQKRYKTDRIKKSVRESFIDTVVGKEENEPPRERVIIREKSSSFGDDWGISKVVAKVAEKTYSVVRETVAKVWNWLFG